MCAEEWRTAFTGEGQKNCELQRSPFKIRGRRNAATEWAWHKSGAVKPALSVLPTLVNRCLPATAGFARTLWQSQVEEGRAARAFVNHESKGGWWLTGDKKWSLASVLSSTSMLELSSVWRNWSKMTFRLHLQETSWAAMLGEASAQSYQQINDVTLAKCEWQ